MNELQGIHNIHRKLPVGHMVESLIISDLVRSKPRKLEVPFSWVEHIPFAFFLVEFLRPRVIVELGTHTGNSFNGFCEAVQRTGSSTRCFAVDTWQGDEHAGAYDSSIYDALSAYQRENYQSFASMLRMTFDEALPKFENGSIDLLHIDGLHTYEAVKLDFDTWLPKVAPGGIILFHDIVVRENNFGVWRLWDELKQSYRTAEFSYGYGLGVVFIPGDRDKDHERLHELLSMESSQKTFAMLGRMVLLEAENEMLKREQHENLQEQKAKMHERLSAHTSDVTVLSQPHDLCVELAWDTGDGYRDELTYRAYPTSTTIDLVYSPQAPITGLRGIQLVPINCAAIISTPVVTVTDSQGSESVLRCSEHRGIIDLTDRDYEVLGETSRFIFTEGLPSSIARIRANYTIESFGSKPIESVRELVESLRSDKSARGAKLAESELFHLLSSLKDGIRDRDAQRRADSAQIAELWGVVRQEMEHRRVRGEALARASRSQEALISAAFQDSSKVGGVRVAERKPSRPNMSCAQLVKVLLRDLSAVPLLRQSPEFDVGYYAPGLQRVKGGRLLSILHYQLLGWKKGLKPSAVFDTNWYREFHQDVGATCCSPLAHYVKHGMGEGRAISQVDEDRRSEQDLAHRVKELNGRLTAIPGMLPDLKAESADVIKLRDEMSQDADAGFTIRTGEVLQKVADINVAIREADQLRAPYDDAPEVSVMIPVFNQLRSTLSCIHSLVRHRSKYSFEIIVVDDCSTDLTVTACGAIPELRIVNKEKNSGFIDSCNRGAQVARGKRVVFLNNDTYVLPQWLDNLVDTFEAVPCTGLVGSQLLYPDGSLQEAGGIIWRDGQAWNYGRNQDAAKGEFNYLRDVDFCSGASLMIDRELFLDLGGFDSHYAPAYCEDVDLAFKVRERGLRVLYQPFSRLIHFEGVSSGTDVRVGVKSYQVANLEKIKTRWAAQLTRHASSDVPPEIARDYQVKGRIFFVDALTPTPDQDAGSIVADTWLTALIEFGYHVTFFADSNRGYISHYTDRLQRIGVYALIPPTSHEVESFISQFGASYDLVIGLRYGSTEPVFRAFEACGLSPKKFFLPIDLHYVREMRQAELNGSADKRQSALETKRDELSVVKESDIILVHSSYEQDELAREIPGADVRVSPIITDVQGCKNSFQDRRDICFVGGFQHVPNIDAVNFFVKEVLPLVNRVLPDVVFKVIGSKPPAELDALCSKNVDILGFVQDLEPLWSTIRLSVAPLRFGAGVKGKVCMSLSYGVPVVCTPIAAEGMGVQDGKEVLIGATAQELADQIVRTYTDPAVWRGLSIAGMKLVDEEFSTATNRKRIAQYLQDVGVGSAPYVDSTAA